MDPEPLRIDYRLFPTAIGPCGITWSPHGICGVQLPETTAARTRARLLRAWPGAQCGPIPHPVQRVIDDIVALLAGERRDLQHAVLDLRALSDFQRRVYAIVRAIAPGQSLSYGEVAALCGEPGAARGVGHALGCNPFPLVVPCHRVLAAHRRSGGFSAPGGVAMKLRLLQLEGWTGGGGSAASPATLALPF